MPPRLRCKFNQISLLIIIIFMLTLSSAAAEPKVINIGIISSGVTNDNDAALSLIRRYNLAYLNEVTKHTHWQYNFFHLPPEKCLEKLNSGELDMIAPVDPAAFQGTDYIFSQGASNYTLLSLYSRAGSSITPTARDMHNARIGYLDISICKNMLNLFLQKNEWHSRLIPYHTGKELLAALQNGEVDAIADSGTNLSGNEKYLTFVNAISQQFMTTPDKVGMMHDLNNALLKIRLKNPSFDTHVRDEYLNPAIYMLTDFSESEKNYMEKARPFRVVFPCEVTPLIYKNQATGEIAGIFPDFLRLIESHSQLKFEIVISDGQQKSRDMLTRGDADMQFAVYTNREQDARQYFSNTVYWLSYSPVVASYGKAASNPKTIVVPSFFPGTRERFSMSYPDAIVNEMDTLRDCLYAVENGYADVAFVPTAFLAKDRSILMHFNLNVLENENVTLPISLMISSRQPELLYNAINTALLSLQLSELDKIVAQNSDPDLSLAYILEKHPLAVSSTVLLLFFIITPTLLLFTRRQLEKQKRLALEKKNSELENALNKMKAIEKARDSYKHAAEIDKLTGCYNKAAMINHSQDVLDKLLPNWEAAFFIIDLDHFKEANDTYGHQHGDEVLIAFTAMLRKILPPYGYLGRFGGDEFTILIIHPRVTNHAKILAEKILDKTRELTINGLNANVTASIGIAISERGTDEQKPERDIARLFANADKALYAVKENGRNNYRLAE